MCPEPRLRGATNLALEPPHFADHLVVRRMAVWQRAWKAPPSLPEGEHAALGFDAPDVSALPYVTQKRRCENRDREPEDKGEHPFRIHGSLLGLVGAYAPAAATIPCNRDRDCPLGPAGRAATKRGFSIRARQATTSVMAEIVPWGRMWPGS